MPPNQTAAPPQSPTPPPPPTSQPAPPTTSPPILPSSIPPQAGPTPPPVPPTPTTPESPPISSPFNVYPVININHPEKPNRLFAVPLIGFLIKIIILIPVAIWLGLLSLVTSPVTLINSFIVLFTGKYWMTSYQLNLGLIRLYTKVTFFMFGLTDKYPGFGLSISDFSVDVSYPEHPNRLFAIPILGGLIRIILIIPYIIYQYILSNATNIGVFFSFFPVLFMGKYPESTFELARDSVRVSQATTSYAAGLSDKYPSFHISMNHKVIKIILIIIGLLLLLGSFSSGYASSKNKQTFQNKRILPSTTRY